MKPDITFGRFELQCIVCELAALVGEISGAKLAAQTIDLKTMDPDAMVGVLENIEENGKGIIKKLNKKYYPISGETPE